MSSVIKVDSCVYSRIGYGRDQNTNSFYMNGKFTSEHHIENVQASMENRGTEYIFAVADNMVCEDPEQDINVSILKEIGRFHEKVTVNGGDLESDIKDLESRINDTERLLSSFLEMNKVPEADLRWNLDFAGLILYDGQFAALTGGSGKVYMMRDGMFKPLASETTRAKRMIDAKVGNEAEADEIQLPGEESTGNTIASDIYDVQEGDTFVLMSDGLFEALGEEKTEDLMALRNDSTYITHRLVDEAMKRKSSGDLTAMVIQVEKIYDQPSSRKAISKTTAKPVPHQQPEQTMQSKQAVKNRVDRLNKVPPVTYKYNKHKRKSNRYQNLVFVGLVILTVAILFTLLGLIINSLMNTVKDDIGSPTPGATETVSPSPDDINPSGEPDDTDGPDEETPTPSPTPDAEIKEHRVKSGESLSSITREYYGDISLMDKLCKYNNISDPNSIQVDQVIKIPPKEVLTAQ